MPLLLVVDDEPQVRDLLRDFLSIGGYDVIEAATGEEGLRLLREERPHLMLLGMTLPDMSGMEVLREVMRSDIAASVVMLTRLLDADIGRQALEEGAFEYLTKPVDLKHLEQLLAYKLAVMTPA